MKTTYLTCWSDYCANKCKIKQFVELQFFKFLPSLNILRTWFSYTRRFKQSDQDSMQILSPFFNKVYAYPKVCNKCRTHRTTNTYTHFFWRAELNARFYLKGTNILFENIGRAYKAYQLFVVVVCYLIWYLQISLPIPRYSMISYFFVASGHPSRSFHGRLNSKHFVTLLQNL